MMEKGKMERGVVEVVDTESLVPQEHLLRKVDRAVAAGDAAQGADRHRVPVVFRIHTKRGTAAFLYGEL